MGIDEGELLAINSNQESRRQSSTGQLVSNMHRLRFSVFERAGRQSSLIAIMDMTISYCCQRETVIRWIVRKSCDPTQLSSAMLLQAGEQVSRCSQRARIFQTKPSDKKTSIGRSSDVPFDKLMSWPSYASCAQ